MYKSFNIPGTPVGKGRPRFTKSGHAFTPEKTRSYESLVRSCYKQSCKGDKLSGALSVMITAYFPPLKSDSKRTWAQKESGQVLPVKKPDCDNIAKAILDALNGLAYDDDSQIVSAVILKKYGFPARVEVMLYEIKQE
nr:MAG TPA: Endodeoxyribonuclease RusA [Caudoviricetes sp.]